MWQVIGGIILAVAGGIWIGARFENWYLNGRYRMTPRWYRVDGMEG
jgi:hypothetical protein